MSKVKPCNNGETVYHAQVSAPIVNHIRKITCVKCGREFNYRGIEDDDALALGVGVCDECMRMMSGGEYDGMTAGDIL